MCFHLQSRGYQQPGIPTTQEPFLSLVAIYSPVVSLSILHIFFNINFIKLQFTCHKLHPFTVHISVVFNIVKSCSSIISLFPEHFYLPQNKPHTHQQLLPISLLPILPLSNHWKSLIYFLSLWICLS